jgi:hypothetical protein
MRNKFFLIKIILIDKKYNIKIYFVFFFLNSFFSQNLSRLLKHQNKYFWSWNIVPVENYLTILFKIQD